MAKNEAKIRFTAETGDFNKNIRKSNDELAKLRAEAQLNAEQMKDTGVTVEGLEAKHQNLSKQLAETQKKTEAMSQKVEKAKQIFGENSDEVKKLETQLLKQQTAQTKLERAVANCSEELKAQKAAANATKSATETLNDTIDDQQNKLNDLKGEYADVVLAYGKNSKEAKELAREIQSLSSELKDNKTKMSAAEKGADKLDNSLDEVEDSVKDVEGGFSTLDGAISVFVGNAMSSLVSGLGEAVSSFASLSEETLEYREDINKLKTAWESAGKSTELATKTYKDFYSVLGEEDRSIEAVNHLAKFVETEEDMATWTNICTGVWGTFGDSLPIEGLTEASNETAKVGQLTGVLADALNWAGVNEEEFQKKLDKCNDEQERTELITETLNGLYEDASKHYKENNKSIIEARKATSNYTDAMADLGEEIEPVNTEITKLKTEFAKELTPVIKKDVVPAFKGFIDELKERGTVKSFANVIGNLAKTILPPLAKVLGFIVDNFSTLVTVIGTAVIAFKAFQAVMAITTAVQAATTAVAGLSAGVGIATTVQTAWNAAMVANPIGALVTAIALLIGGIVALCAAQEVAIEPVDVLTEEEKELAAAADEAAQSFRDQQSATTETVSGIMSEMGHIQSLANELQTLASAKGEVKKQDEGRVQFILNELNEALGTEYTMVDGVVQKYGDLKKNINAVIQAKTANALLEANNANYLEAMQEEANALENCNLKEKEYQAAKEQTKQKEQEYVTERENLELRLQGAIEAGNTYEQGILNSKIGRLDAEMQKYRDTEKGKKEAWEKSLADYGNYHNTVLNYREAEQAALEGNYDRTIEIFKGKANTYDTYSDNVDQATREAIDALKQEAINAGLEADRTKRNFENGVKGYAQPMVDEAEEKYQKALKKWASAYNDANAVGTDLGDGLKAGMEGTEGGLIKKAKSLVNGIISAMRKEADSHSPSRKMIDFGEDMGEGGEIGLENKSADMQKVAKKQVGDLLDIYSGAGNSVAPFSSLNKGFGGYDLNQKVHSHAVDTVGNGLQNSNFGRYIKAVEELASRAIELNINGKRFATATANDTDQVNGDRMVLAKMGLAIG